MSRSSVFITNRTIKLAQIWEPSIQKQFPFLSPSAFVSFLPHLTPPPPSTYLHSFSPNASSQPPFFIFLFSFPPSSSMFAPSLHPSLFLLLSTSPSSLVLSYSSFLSFYHSYFYFFIHKSVCFFIICPPLFSVLASFLFPSLSLSASLLFSPFLNISTLFNLSLGSFFSSSSSSAQTYVLDQRAVGVSLTLTHPLIGQPQLSVMTTAPSSAFK